MTSAQVMLTLPSEDHTVRSAGEGYYLHFMQEEWKLRLTEGEDSVLSLSPQTPVPSLFLTQREMESSVQIHSAKEKRQESNGGHRIRPSPSVFTTPLEQTGALPTCPYLTLHLPQLPIRKHLLHFPPSFWQQPPPPAIHVASVT